jgi:transposase-like protein
LSHGFVSTTVHQGVQAGRCAASENGASIAEVARAFEVNPNVLHRWRREFPDGPGNAFSGPGKRRWEESRVAQLERKIGQQTLEIDFLKGYLQRIEEQRQLQAITQNRIEIWSCGMPSNASPWSFLAMAGPA